MIKPNSDSDWLDAAARLSLRGRPLSAPNPSVAAILVKDARVIGRGWTQAGGRPHAEAIALEQAGTAAQEATAYVTLEPCAHTSDRGPACADLLAKSGIARAVIGQLDPDPRTSGQGAQRLKAAGISVEVLDHPASRRALAGYLTRQTKGRPHVTLKLGISLDGKIALADGTSQWITGEEARAHVHSRRAMADAILVGGQTWRSDAPRLDVRLAGLEDRSPQRVVLTRGVAPDGVKIINTPAQISGLDSVQYLYVEGGAQTAASFLSEDLIDRLEIYRAPIVIGNGLDCLGDFGLETLSEAHGRWSLAERRALGSDLFEAYERRNTQGTARQ
ncbi:bifunctional diaminohydroxyphosphoribosylaminopyrimidine deaminase/5-amino-6-(5-phosphoribosylamino)uracil reductase RibD [Erythrobacter sp. W53]|uniref:bifunctional diaminohydroxyphosphoribosylaminopyrimidine deaminase/5-amino-6-(5-phosphoribosylamino)uracil reductase RibD n=1 Tax=Erythrobacter sp. W53 TaxID=3425947 RepID=UPI003D769BA8